MITPIHKPASLQREPAASDVSSQVAKPAAARDNAAIYHLKVVLRESEPPIWRMLQVPGNANLGWLHSVLQVAMGWTNSHLHHFLTRDGRYSDPRHVDEYMDFGDEPDRDERQATLAQIAPDEGAQFGYEYDFGDSWDHEITVARILPAAAAGATTAICLGGARSCPPEDCGGFWGYAELLKTLANPKHPEHKSMKEWLGRPFDAEMFDVVATNRWLRKLKWPRVTEAQLAKVLMGRDGYRE